MSQARDQARAHRIDRRGVNYRDCLGFIPCCHRRWRSHHDDRIDVELDQLLGDVFETLGLALRISPFDDKILSLDISELAKACEQRIVKLLIAMSDKSDAPDFSGLLRKNPGRHKDCTSRKSNELAPPHMQPPIRARSR